MPGAGFCTRPSRGRVHDRCMDILAVAMGLAAFAILLGLIFAIDRI
jgi:hypothetical protein